MYVNLITTDSYEVSRAKFLEMFKHNILDHYQYLLDHLYMQLQSH